MFKFDLLKAQPWRTFYDNTVDAFIPELWSAESLIILVENMIAGNLVLRDFENELANYGDVVNTRRAGDFIAQRKTNSDDVVIQNAVATNVPVKLDQHVHTSFLIRDGEESKSFKDLIDEFLYPATLAQARFIDKLVLGQYAQFMGTVSGGLNNLDTTNAKNSLLDLRQKFNQNKAPMMPRNLVLNPVTESLMLKLDIFTQAQQVGDQGQALQNATLGRKLGWDMWLDQNMPVIQTGNTVATGAVNNVGGYPKGTTTMTIDLFVAAIGNNTWFTVVGDNTPQRVVSTVGGATPTSVTFTPGLNAPVADDAVITSYTPGAVDNVAGYPLGYAKEITVEDFTVAPQIGQTVTIGTDPTSQIYSIVALNANPLIGITLDKPLGAAINDEDQVCLGPAGAYNFGFNREALALVVRPLAKPRPGTGALSAVVNWNGLSMRTTITYQGQMQGHLVTLDMLCGIAVLDSRLGGVLLG